MAILIFFAFLAGVVTVLSPCILPILPIVLSGSLSGGKKRPLGIVAGFILSFTFFTLTLSAIVKATGLGADVLRTFAIVTIGLFGASLLIPQTQVLLERIMSRVSFLMPKTSTTDAGFLGGLIVGISIGLLWTPCVGPILASVITLALSGSTSLSAVFITLSYSIGTGLPMLAITYGGRTLLQKVPRLLSNTARIQKGFGVVMIALAVALYANVDRQFQTILLRTFPQYGTGLTAIENTAVVRSALEQFSNPTSPQVAQSSLAVIAPAPDPTFAGATKWLNSEPLSLETNLKGKVVLVDFWTYSCINCIRTLPYLREWYTKYKDAGFVIVGVHAPEFEFEKDEDNVRKALRDFNIEYPVVQDNEFLIWRAYRNQYWPAKYLIDARGQVRYTHFGEGEYEQTERNIQDLLKEAGVSAAPQPLTPEEEKKARLFPTRITPETYLGYDRADSYTDSQQALVNDRVSSYSFQSPLASNEVGLLGAWKVENERITSVSDTSTLTLNFMAAKVYLVLTGKNEQNLPITVKLDGKDIPKEMQTADYSTTQGIVINSDRKYDIVSLEKSEQHTVELTIPTGISAYAFTFGG